jgi:large subunit ribosomal protein L29
MKAAEFRGLSEADLQRRLADSRQELFNLRFQLATRKLENVARIREVRKDIARILQVANERRSEASGGATATAATASR